MLSKGTVTRVIDTMKRVYNTWVRKIKRGERVEASISDGNTKIGKTINVSLAPILSCGNCTACMYTCYAVKNIVRRGLTVLNAWVKNYALAVYDRPEYFRQIREKCRRRRTNKFFRWHVSGDILDADYFAEMNNVALEFADFKYWTYTEMQHLVNAFCDEHGRDAVADNLNIMYSDWSLFTGVPINNPYGFKRFIVVPKNMENKPNGFYCPGNCDICKAKNVGCVGYQTDVYAIQH